MNHPSCHRSSVHWLMTPLLTLTIMMWGPSLLHAQTLSGPGEAGGVPQPLGSMLQPGGSGTFYFLGHPGNLTLDASQSIYDAVAWVPRWDPVPNNWVQGFGGEARQCEPGMGDMGSFGYRVPLPWGNTIVNNSWGTSCYGLWNPDTMTIFHYAGQPNGPTFLPPLPVTFVNPANVLICSKAGDPCDTSTGLYSQQDTDIEVPDVIPIKLTRTYRTNDTGARVFGIGASHDYAHYLMRDDLCSLVRIVMPDGGYREFTRTSGTTCLDSTLQHTTTQTAFYGATFLWDQSIERYRLRFKDGTEWRFSDYGWLVTMLDRNGNALALTRAKAGGLAGNLTRITTPNGRYLTFG